MKISRIYSNKNFKNITFNLTGLNVIFGRIFDPENLESDSHNLGKSILLDVIDFILLKGVRSKDNFFLTRGEFEGQDFYGEFALNNGKFLIIKRCVEKNTKISYAINNTRLDDFKLDISWNENDIPLKTAKEKINEVLAFSALQSWEYRKSIDYFLRHQQDYQDLFKLNKFKGKDMDWKPVMFELFGFNGQVIEDKYKKNEEMKDLKKKLEILEDEANITVKDKDEILGLLQIKKEERDILASQIDKFNFSDFDHEYNEKLVEEIDAQLQNLHSQRYFLSSEISRISKSLQEDDITVDIQKLENLFKEVNIALPHNVIDNFQQLISFNTEITQERRVILRRNLKENEQELEKIQKSIHELNNEKNEKLHYLTEYDSFTKFKKHQKELSKLEAVILSLEERLNMLSKSSEINEEIENCKEDIQKLIKLIDEEIGKQKHSNIRKIFNSILKEILNTDAILSLTRNKAGNVDFNANIQNPEDLTITNEEYGTTYKKLMCIAFDMSLLIHYYSESFFRFAYHDGALDALDNRKKMLFLKKSREICSEYNLQHIITLISTDIQRDKFGAPVQFNEGEIILELNDKDESGLLFEKKF